MNNKIINILYNKIIIHTNEYINFYNFIFFIKSKNGDWGDGC